MSTVDPDALAREAFQALEGGEPRKARTLLLDASRAAPERADLVHALGTVHVHLGESELGKQLMEQALALLGEQLAAAPERASALAPMREGFLLGLAAACEDLDLPNEAEAAYRSVLEASPGQPRARQGLAHLLASWGRNAEALEALERYVREAQDERPYLEGEQAWLEAARGFERARVHPRELLVAHRESYVEMFDHYAAEQAKLGWIAEAGRMRRAPDGRIVPILPEGARPYAAVRVDLVNPQTSEVGQVGDQPMVVALQGYEPLAQAPVSFDWPEHPFRVRVSSQAPWDQLPLHVAFRAEGGLEALDGVIGDWYTRGFNGAFGTPDGQRFHYVSDPEPRREGRAVTYNVDLGRARIEALDDLLARLAVLHATHPLAEVLIGRGMIR
jgi:tetratricopeptide (TPR) repeat protein